MTCAVPNCQELSVTAGVCSAHWLEADEAARGAERIEHELALIHREEREAKARQLEQLKAAAALRKIRPDADRVQRIVDAIVSRFWSEAAADSGRNQALAGAAWALGRLVAGGEVQDDQARALLISEGVKAGLPWAEARDTVAGQMRRARVNPRVLERAQTMRVDLAVKL